MADPFNHMTPILDSPGESIAAVMPSDSVDLPNASRALYIGTGGNLRVTTVGGTTETLSNLPSGFVLSLRVSRVWAQDRTADDIVAIW